MAIENLIIRKKRSIAGIELDGVIIERFSNAVVVTENPVEFGADITDHAIIQPKFYSIEAVVSNTPLATAAFGRIIDDVTGLFGDSTGQGLTRAQTAYAALVSLMETREPISVQTGLTLLVNMVITNIDTSRNKDTSGALFFGMDLREVLIVNTEIVDRPEEIFEGDTQMQATTPTEEGRQLKEPITSNEQSILAKALDLIGN